MKYENKFDNIVDEEDNQRVKKIGDKSFILKNRYTKERERSRDNDNRMYGRDNRDTRSREMSFRGGREYHNKFVGTDRYKFNEQQYLFFLS